MEHVICRHILDHLDTNNILSVFQHGFRAMRSCETQLITTIQDLMHNFDRKQQVDIAILDFAKAFDTVPHDKLLYKIHHYGINNNVHKWISSFLKGRTQSVVVEGEQAAPATVSSGVPQGTVLGPLLFLLHINDLPQNVASKVRLFADDCLLYRTIDSEADQRELQKDLTSLEQWGERWGMRFNASKCEIMRISRSSNPINSVSMYTLAGVTLREVDNARYLGVTLTNSLSWSTHINNITSKANSKIGFLWRNLQHCPKQLREQAYIALVRSVLEYSCAVWDPHLRKDIQALESVQRRAARFVTRDSGRTSSVSTMLRELGWASLAVRRKNIRLALLAKIVTGKAQVPTDGVLTPSDSRTRANHQYKYKIVPAQSQQYKNSFFIRTIPQWNSLSAAELLKLPGFRQAGPALAPQAVITGRQ